MAASEDDIINEFPVCASEEEEREMVLTEIIIAPEMNTKDAQRRISESRRFSISGESADDDPLVYKKIVIPKTPEEYNRIRQACSGTHFLTCLDEIQKKTIFDAMREIKIEPNETIIEQGSNEHDFFYVIESGDFDVIYHDKLEGTEEILNQYHSSGSFGELSLLYNCPRSATIISTTPGIIWALDKTTFRHVVVRTQVDRRRRTAQFLRRVPLLSSLNEIELSKIADVCESVSYVDNEYVVTEGGNGDSFYIVEDGLCIATQHLNGIEREVGRVGPGGYFGERSIVLNEPRAANIKVWCDVLRCFRIDLVNFRRIVREFDLGKYLEIQISSYQKVSINHPKILASEQIIDNESKSDDFDSEDEDDLEELL